MIMTWAWLLVTTLGGRCLDNIVTPILVCALCMGVYVWVCVYGYGYVCMGIWYGWYGCMVWVHGMGVWYGCMVWVYGMGVWYGCMVWVYGMGIWYGCMVWVYGMGIWYGCMGVWYGYMVWVYGCMACVHMHIMFTVYFSEGGRLFEFIVSTILIHSTHVQLVTKKHTTHAGNVVK